MQEFIQVVASSQIVITCKVVNILLVVLGLEGDPPFLEDSLNSYIKTTRGASDKDFKDED